MGSRLGRILKSYLFLPLIAFGPMVGAAVPTHVTYQGRVLQSNGTPVTGSKLITLTLKPNPGDPGTIVYSSPVTLSTQGEFSISFNVPGGFDWDSGDPRLEIKVESDTLTPDENFGVTPYSFLAAKVAAGGVTTTAIANGAVTDVKVSTVSAAKIMLPGGATAVSTWQLGSTGNVDASKVALPGSTATVSSWQYGSSGFIDVAKVTGTIPTTPSAHAASHGLTGTDPLSGLSPLQISGTALVSRSTYSQTVQPQLGSDVVPLVIRPNNSIPANLIDALSVYKADQSTASFSVRGDGAITARGTLTVAGAVTVNSAVTVSGNLNVSTLVPTGSLHVSGRVKDNYGFLVPAGTIVAFAGASAPAGWLLCDGATKDVSLQPELTDLKAVLGSTYGTATATTFVLPNLKGRVPMGSGVGTGPTNWMIGTSTGSETHVLSIAEMPSHHHGGVVVNSTSENYSPNNNSAIKTLTYGNSQDTGGGQPHPNIQPSLVVNYIIKY